LEVPVIRIEAASGLTRIKSMMRKRGFLVLGRLIYAPECLGVATRRGGLYVSRW